MIKINQQLIKENQIDQGNFSQSEAAIIEMMGKYSKVYEFSTLEALEFELALRQETIKSAILLFKSGARFATFRTSRCNPQYWIRNNKGGFALRPDVLPKSAIDDIFNNGSKYAFECATAIVIVYYKAVSESIKKDQFNRLFADLLLYDWNYDEDLRLDLQNGTDYLPGDCLYFSNPQHDPKTPEWQGENTILLEENLYYGHGIGIGTKQQMIQVLNKKREKNADKSAFLEEQTLRLDYNYLSQFRKKDFRLNSLSRRAFYESSNLAVSEIGTQTFLH